MYEKRVTIFMGHYGSGKTFVSVNYAIELARQGKPVSIYDLDIVNPYFRTVDAKNKLATAGVELVVSKFAQTNVDIPAMNAKSYQMIDNKSRFAVADIGGDDRGALALGRFSEKLKEDGDYDALWVINKFRPETRNIEDALLLKEEIEKTAKLSFTGIVNNANLGIETTEETILSGLDFVINLSKTCGIPVKFTSARKDLITENLKKKIKQILPVDPIKYGNWV